MSDSKRAVLLMAYGGPDSLDDVERYLLDVRGGRTPPPEIVEEASRKYALIGGKSPLLDITRAQAAALEARLNNSVSGPGWRVYVGMRHWRPYIRDAVAELARDGVRNLVALCATPHYSGVSVGAYFKKLAEAQEALGARVETARVDSYHSHPLFIQAVSEKASAALERFPSSARPRVRVLFTAHSLPAALVEQGDPYAAQVQETARLVAERLQLPPGRWRLCYQSAPRGAAKWLGPSLETVLEALADDGHRDILVAPIGFVADHLEVLYDIDIACRAAGAARSVRLERTDSLNDSPTFVAALADLVARATEGLPR